MYKTMPENIKKSKLRGAQLYKVLVGDQPCHGGNGTYPLPTQNADGSWTPGAWTAEIASPVLCRSGYHLTTEPFTTWKKDGMTVYLAEGKGSYAVEHGYAYSRRGTRRGMAPVGDKIAFSKVRLLRPVEAPATLAAAVAQAQGLIDTLATNFLVPDGAPDEAWKVFHTEREAQYELIRTTGASGFPSAPTTGAENDYFLNQSGFRSVVIPADLGYKRGAYPATFIREVARWGLSTTPAPEIVGAYINAWSKGYGVAGHGQDGVLFVYEAY